MTNSFITHMEDFEVAVCFTICVELSFISDYDRCFNSNVTQLYIYFIFSYHFIQTHRITLFSNLHTIK